MSILEFSKTPEAIKAQKAAKQSKRFLGLKVGDGYEEISYALRVWGIGDYRESFRDLNIDDATRSRFFQGNGPFTVSLVTKVNEEYAMVVKIDLQTMSTTETYGHEYPHHIQYDGIVDCFVLGRDDENKVFVHWLEREQNKRIDVFLPYFNTVPPTTIDHNWYEREAFKKDFIGNPHNDKWAAFEMHDVVHVMNKSEIGFTRLQGDIIYQIIHGKKGYCQTCKSPYHGGFRATGKRRANGARWMGQTEKQVYEVYPDGRAINKIKMCEDCIERLGTYIDDGILFGNHVIKSDANRLLSIVGEISSRFGSFGGANADATRFGRDDMAEIVRRFWSSADNLSGPSMRFDDTERRGYQFKPESIHNLKDRTIELPKLTIDDTIPPDRFMIWDSSRSFGSVNPARQIIAMGGQNVILEHPQHKEKSVYVPKDSVAMFQNQVTYAPVQGGD
jgi:hypothetical protein